MKKQLIIASAALLLGSFACKKNETSPLQNQGLEASAPTNEVKQKMFTLSSDETIDFIKHLKNQFVTNSKQQKTVQNVGSFATDSSLWVIEALLNYDFDNANDPEPIGGDSLTFDIIIENENVVANSEITNAYDYFSSQINAHLTSNPNERVKIIDVTATGNTNILNVKANVIYTANNSGQKVSSSPCDPIAVQGHWSGGASGYGYICTSIPGSQRGPNMCNRRLNCSYPVCPNGYSPTYSNVTTITIGTNNGTYNPFHYYYGLPGTAPCNTEYLTASHLNSNVSLAQSYAASNLPSSPTGMVTTNYNFYNSIGFPINGNYSIMAGYWQLRITYGLPACGGGLPD